MDLQLETIILWAGMLVVCCIPLLFRRIENYSRAFFVFGTGAMFGICVFDLIPDVAELGGRSGLLLTVLVGLIYSIIHLFHLRHHGAEVAGHDHHHHHAQSFYLFFLSLATHCFASGILLAVSQGLSSRIANSVFLALLAHKGYESLTFTSILLNEERSTSWNLSAIFCYCAALPLGVAITFILQDQLSQTFAIYASSVAVGSLLGCLIFDFMLPSYRHLQEKKTYAIWLVLGLIATRFFLG